MSRRLQRGDVFLVGAEKTGFGLCQIVGFYEVHAVYCVVFEGLHAQEDALASVQGAVPRLLGLVLDSRLVSGGWRVIGNLPVDPKISLPVYKGTVGWPVRWALSDSVGERRIEVSEEQAAFYPYREIISPAYFERAVLAAEGIVAWNAAFDGLRIELMATEESVYGP